MAPQDNDIQSADNQPIIIKQKQKRFRPLQSSDANQDTILIGSTVQLNASMSSHTPDPIFADLDTNNVSGVSPADYIGSLVLACMPLIQHWYTKMHTLKKSLLYHHEALDSGAELIIMNRALKWLTATVKYYQSEYQRVQPNGYLHQFAVMNDIDRIISEQTDAMSNDDITIGNDMTIKTESRFDASESKSNVLNDNDIDFPHVHHDSKQMSL